MIVAGGWLGSQGGSRSEDLTCYTSPVIHQEVYWPHGWGAFSIALTIFACVFLAVMTVWFWRDFRPCDTCDEYRANCRCKARAY